VLVEKTDRLYRNYRDLVTISDLEINIHLVKENSIIGPDSKSHEKLVHDFKVMLAKNYVDNLAEETSKGMQEKAEQGLWPSFAPLGYLNNRETKGIDIDFKRAPIIRELFEIYSEGKSTLRDLTRIASEKGLRTRKGNTVSRSNIHKMLKNPIFIGDFIWKDVCFKGKHDPIISRECFETVQGVLKNRTRPRNTKHKFAFRGLIKCGHCGCSVTSEIKKGKYVYYHCTKTKQKCPDKPIREEKLAEMLGEPLKKLRITEERLEWIIGALKESHKDEKRFRTEEINKLRKEYEGLERRTSQLYEDKLDGTISLNFWKSKSKEYQSRQNKITEKIERYNTAGRKYLEDGVRILELSQKAYSLYVTQDYWEQRKLLDLIVSNSVLKDGKLHTELRKPFDMLADGVAEESLLISKKAPKEALNEIWLLR